jgi:hypothetical protein
MFLFSSISGDYPSLQAHCQIFLDRAVWLESPVSHSVDPDIQIHFIYLTSHTVFLIFISISLRNILIPFTYGHSSFVIKLFQRDDRYPL